MSETLLYFTYSYIDQAHFSICKYISSEIAIGAVNGTTICTLNQWIDNYSSKVCRRSLTVKVLKLYANKH